MIVSSVITAAGKNSRMEKSQSENNLPIKNKLLLPFPNKTSEKNIIETTINNVLSSGVDECIIVLGHFAEEIKEVLLNINDDRIKIIENKNHNVGLTSSLLNGLNHCKNEYVLCVASDQPTVSSKTYKNINDIITNFNNKKIDNIDIKKIVSILRRRQTGILNSPEGLGMPFMINKNQFSKYLQGEDDNLNPILRNVFDDGFCFFAVKEENELELININTFEEYKFVLNSIKNK